MVDFGNLRPVSVREIWASEARDFTPWLASEIEQLAETLGMELEVIKTEEDVGDFKVDILAKEVGSGRNVVIENEFGSTNHNHLGQLLTYAAGLDAKVVIWVTETVRDEYRQALEWLNRHTNSDTDFFAVTVEVFRIDDSRPAFEFEAVVLPNEWGRRQRQSVDNVGVSPRGKAYQRFFQGLLDELREKHHFTGARVGQPQSWYAFSSGTAGVQYSAAFAQHDRVKAEVYIDQGDTERNKALFDRLHSQKETLERDFGEPLQWERLDHRRASRIAVYRAGSIDRIDVEGKEIQAWLVDHLLRLRRVLGPPISREAAL